MYLRLRTQILLLEVEALALRAEMGEISREYRGVHRGPAQTHQQMAWRYQWQTGQQLARHRADMRKTIKGVKLTTNQYQQEAEALGLKKKELRGQQEDLRAHKVAQASEAEHRARQRQAQLGDRLGRLAREFDPLRMSLNGIAPKGTLQMDTLVTSELDYVCFRLANFFEGLATRVAALMEPVQRRPV
jgi:septal ring factor EnvC (AmiA/AmiB activator)